MNPIPGSIVIYTTDFNRNCAAIVTCCASNGMCNLQVLLDSRSQECAFVPQGTGPNTWRELPLDVAERVWSLNRIVNKEEANASSTAVSKAYVVMVGDRVRAVFTDDANNGDGLQAASEFARLLGASSADDPQAIARSQACWVALAPNLNGVEVEVPTVAARGRPGLPHWVSGADPSSELPVVAFRSTGVRNPVDADTEPNPDLLLPAPGAGDRAGCHGPPAEPRH